MRTLVAAARFVAKWEGWLPTAYLDTLASPDVWTQGFGHTRYAGRPYPPDGTWSKAKGYRVLARDLRDSARVVNELVKHKLTLRQRMALISFIFNLGPGILPHTALLRALNRGEFHLAARHMLEYDHAGGVVVQGLRNRRHAEAWLLTNPRARDPKPSRATLADQVHVKSERRG